MKFIVDRKAFVEAIKPAMEVAGKRVGNYDDVIYSAITSPSVKGGVSGDLRRDLDKFRRLTFDALKNKFTISATDGNITLVTTIEGDGFVPLGYDCKEEGILTVESAQFWIAMESLEKYERLIFSSGDGPIVTIQSEEKGAIRRFEKCCYNIVSKPNKSLKYVGAINPKVLADGIFRVKFAFDSRNTQGERGNVIAHLSPNKIRLIGDNGELVAINDITLDKNVSNKNIKFAIDRDLANSLIKSLSKLEKSQDVEIWHCSKPRSDKKPWRIIFKQDETVFSFSATNADTKVAIFDEMSDRKYKYKACTKAEDWKTIFIPKIISKYPTTMIKADFIDGYFHIEQQSASKADSYVSFVYDSGVSYVDIKSIRSEEVSFKTRSAHLATVFKKAKPNDTLRIEFGEYCSDAKKEEGHLKNWVLVRYPTNRNKKSGTRQQLVAFIPKDPRKDNSND